jgi:hypothetical protein
VQVLKNNGKVDLEQKETTIQLKQISGKVFFTKQTQQKKAKLLNWYRHEIAAKKQRKAKPFEQEEFL